MSERIAYLERQDQGDQFRRLRLIGGRKELEWTPAPDLTPQAACEQAAQWIKSALADDSGRSLAMLCLDAEAGLWTWMDPPNSDGRMVESMLRQAGGDALLLGLDAMAIGMEGGNSATIAPEIDVPGAVGVQLLAPPQPSLASARLIQRLRRKPAEGGSEPAEHERSPVFSIRDALARVLLDELDNACVGVGSVTSVWHALAAACDPAGPGLGGDEGSSKGVVAQSEQAHASVLVDPAGRIVWVWSYKAEVLAGGALRLAVADGTVRITTSDVSRLVTEWMAWSAQTGIVPSRVSCLCPETDAAGMSPSQFGSSIAAGFRDIPVDLAVTPDPVADILSRLRGLNPQVVSPPPDPRRALVELAHRPGRAHRAMYRWAALGLVAASLVLAVVSWKLFSVAKESRQAASALRRESLEIYRKYVPSDPAQGSLAVVKLGAAVNKLRETAPAPMTLEPAKPILEELDTIMFLIPTFGQMGLELQSLVIDDIRAELIVIVNDLAMYEQFRAAVTEIAGSRVNWALPVTSETPDGRIRATFRGSWVASATPAGGPGR